MNIKDNVAIDLVVRWLTEEVLTHPTMARAFVLYARNRGGWQWENWAAAQGKLGDDAALALDAAAALIAAVTEAHLLELDKLAAQVEVRQVLDDAQQPPGMV
jgi:oligoribonuclease NrnB/cAMP/cGMP phosphodiesterase (DHH superfamily)